MYYQNYEDYMRSILGYPMQSANEQNTYQPEDFYTYNPAMQFNQSNQELENLYPETYKIIYPMICKICDKNRHKPITAELLDEMTKEIYENVEVDEQFNINVKTEVNVQTKTTTQNNRQVNRRPNNYLLNDLIRILILRNLLGNPIRPPRPPRPPFPGGPGFPPPRPGYFN